MKYIDRLIEVTADWFMEFFLDPAYVVVETGDATIEVVSIDEQVFEPVTMVNNDDNRVVSSAGSTLAALSEKLLDIFTDSVERIVALPISIANYYNNNISISTLSIDIKLYVSNNIWSSKWLTG